MCNYETAFNRVRNLGSVLPLTIEEGRTEVVVTAELHRYGLRLVAVNSVTSEIDARVVSWDLMVLRGDVSSMFSKDPILAHLRDLLRGMSLSRSAIDKALKKVAP